MIKFNECPKVGDRVFGRMIAGSNCGTLEKMGWGTVFSVKPSVNEGMTNVYVNGEGLFDDLNWGCHSFWEEEIKGFPYDGDVLMRPDRSVSEALEAHKRHLDNRRAMLCL